MQKVMDQLHRVLKPTGSCWVNIGDSYSNNNSSYSRGRQGWGNDKNGMQDNRQKGIMVKSLMGIPARFQINCIDSGWGCRQFIPWVKSNPLPSPVKDRFTNKWEPVFFFVKNPKYYFNLNPLREEPITKVRSQKRNNEKYTDKNSNVSRLHKNWGNSQDRTLDGDGKPNPLYKGFNDRWKNNTGHSVGKNPGDIFNINTKPLFSLCGNCSIKGKNITVRTDKNGKVINDKDGLPVRYCKNCNKEDILDHHAAFPVGLPLRILKCACPKEVCVMCGVPKFPIEKDGKITFSKCDCNAGFRPGIVLDPFMGAGSTAMAAEELHLNWIGIELNENYIRYARKRLTVFDCERLV